MINNPSNTYQHLDAKTKPKIIDIAKFVKAKTLGPEERDDMIKNFYNSGAISPKTFLCGGLDVPGWERQEVLVRLKGLDLTQKGFLLVERDYNNTESSEKQWHDLYPLENSVQLKILMRYLGQIKLDAEALLIGYAQKQIIIFGESAYQYPVRSNF